MADDHHIIARRIAALRSGIEKGATVSICDERSARTFHHEADMAREIIRLRERLDLLEAM